MRDMPNSIFSIFGETIPPDFTELISGLVEENRQTLDFIYNHDSVSRIDFLGDAARILA